MRKAVERRYFDKDNTMYFLTVGNAFIGLFDNHDNQISTIVDKNLDMGKLIVNKQTYVIRVFKRKGVCLLFRLNNNDIELNNPKVFALHSVKINYIDLWKDLDL